MDWYCVVRGERRGPMSWEELRSLAARGELTLTDLVWQPAFGDRWRAAGEVRELFEPAIGAAPPRPPSAASSPSPRSEAPLPRPQEPLDYREGHRPGGHRAGVLAWRRMRGILFRPFDLVRWFSIGFCAWLAAFGAGGCGLEGIDFRKLRAAVKSREVPIEDLQREFQKLLDAIPREVTQGLVIVLAVAAVMVIVVSLLFAWLRARGTFMVLHRLHRPYATIRESWEEAGLTAGSLFRWRVGLWLCGAAAILLTLGGMMRTVILPAWQDGGLHAAALNVKMLATWSGLLVVVIAVYSLVQALTHHFVEPVMYWRKVGVLAAWRVVGDLCGQYWGAVGFYFLWLLWWWFLATLALLGFVLLTCCIGCVVIVLPFLGAVALLPLTLFFRAAGMEFVRQWRPDLVPPGLDAAGKE